MTTYLHRIYKTVFAIIIIIFFIPPIANFLEIDFSTYGIYIIWYIVILIFYAILPPDQLSIFSEIHSS